MSVLDTASVGAVEPSSPSTAPRRTPLPPSPDAESQECLRPRRTGGTREETLASLPHLRGNELFDIAAVQTAISDVDR